MSVEIEDRDRVNEIPNPYVIENWALLIVAVTAFVAGLMILLDGRAQWLAAGAGASLAPILIGVALWGVAFRLAASALSQLRFILPVDYPKSLCPVVADNASGTSNAAENLKDQIRKNALLFVPPQDAVSNLLYTLVKGITRAPIQLQYFARYNFGNFCAVALALASYLFSLFLMGTTPFENWLGVAYGVVMVIWLLRTINANATAEVSMRPLIVLTVFAIFFPVVFLLVGQSLPTLGEVAVNWHVGFMLVALLAVYGLFLAAVKSQLGSGVNTPPAMKQAVLSVNFNPSELIGELERLVLRSNPTRLPNRRYIRTPFQLDSSREAGEFRAEFLEETQPVNAGRRETAQEVLGSPRRLWLVVLTALMTLAGLACVFLVYRFAGLAWGETGTLETGAWAIVAYTIATAARRAAHVLWGRFDFQSRLVWMELTGVYNTASAAVGNQFTGNYSTQKRVVNVENLTLTLWVTDLETVTFGKDGDRSIYGMSGPQETADATIGALVRFSEGQSMIVAPGTAADMERMSALSAFNQGAGSAGTPTLPGMEKRSEPES